METIFINGKFTAQRTTGVQRVATRLVLALDLLVEDGERWTLLCPPGGAALPLKRIEQRPVGQAGAPLHVWEQSTLPWSARRGLLLSLAGSAPWFASRQAVVLHDAAVFDYPQAYTRAFRSWYRHLFRRLARHADPLFTVSRFSRDRLALWLGVGAERWVVVPNGADHLETVVSAQTATAVGPRYLLAVASANPTKNLPALFTAFARLAEPGLRLVVVGGTNARVFSGGGVAVDPPGLVRLGPVDDASLKALYRQAIALVCPSYYEGFGLPPLEAMAMGCPVAVARAASLPETCGDAALYFDPHDADAIAQAMRRLIDDAALRERMRRAGAVHAARYRWADAAATLRQALPRSLG